MHSMPRRFSKKLIVAAALALLPVVYFYPAVLGQLSLVPGDGWTQNLGVRVLIGQMISHGMLPLWNPLIFAGTPLMASIYPGAFYPPNWIFALFSPNVAMNIVVITTYHIALIGSYLYARRIGGGRVAALVTGLAFAFGAYMMFHLGHTSRIAAAAWLPWVVLALESLYQRASWRWITLGALFIALQLFAGEPQMNCYTVIVAGAYGLFSLTLREEREQRWRFAGAALLMAVCGLLFSAIQLLPEQELLQQGERAHITYDYFAGYSLPPQQVLALVFPFFFGGAVKPPFTVPYWGQWGGETFGYTGLLTLLLGLLALVGPRRQRLAWFWMAMAVLSLLLAFGDHLPFKLNQRLYHVPVYNLFRVLGRHMFEFTFSMAVLAGLGVNYVAQMDPKVARLAVRRATTVFAAIIAVVLVMYLFFGARLETLTPRPPNANSLANLEVLLPLGFSVLSVAALWFYARHKTTLAGAALVAVLLADLVSFGHFLEWRIVPYNIKTMLPDAPTVQFIKARERDLQSFRILSHSLWPYDYQYEMLDHPNVSIARGLQSVNGYDALRLPRLAAVAGEMSIDGVVGDLGSFALTNQGFNLLNVKYLLRERRGSLEPGRGIFHEGVPFSEVPLDLKLSPGKHLEMMPGGTAANELALVTTLGRATHIPQGTPIVKITLHTREERVIALELQAGRDTSEWAYDRADTRAEAKHQQAKIAESWPEAGFQGHRYLARLPFDRAEIERVEWDYLLPDAEAQIFRASLYDSTTRNSVPLDNLLLPLERWRKVAHFGQVEIYENLKQMPRAWFVKRLQVALSGEVIQAIKQGQLSDEEPFDPAETALLETEDFGGQPIKLPPVGDTAGAQVKVTRYEPHRIEIETHNPQPSFLVLSENYYRGWDALIDGQKAPVYRADYTLRGLAVPAGDHRIEYVFRAPTFRNGLVFSALGVLIILAGVLVSRIGPGTRAGKLIGKFFVAHHLIIAALTLLLFYSAILASQASQVVGGSDSAGYATLARSILKGEVSPTIPMLEHLDLPESFGKVFLPLAYNPGARAKTMAPLYPVGFPLHLAVGALIAGWERGPFLVSPLMAVFSVILMYLLGRELGLSRAYSAVGAVILAAYPTFIAMALQPMSDVTATFWALAAIYAALRSRRQITYALVAGAAFGVGFLVRPTNLFVLAPLLFSLPLKPRALFYFFLGGLPLAGIFLAYNLAAYGHPLRTGYGTIQLQNAVMIQDFTKRLGSYAHWLMVTLSPLPMLGWLGLAFNRKVVWRDRALLLAWFGAFFLFYCCYDVYGDWWYTRFLLPAIPALILGTLLTVHVASDYFKRFTAWRNQAGARWATAILLIFIVLAYEQQAIARYQVLETGAGQISHRVSCEWADRLLPPQSLVVSSDMSGAINFYTTRPCVRWDQVRSADQWQLLKQHAAEKGYHWYALLLPHEIELAQQYVPGHWIKLGTLDAMSLWQIEPGS